jgi:hypothetical protein
MTSRETHIDLEDQVSSTLHDAPAQRTCVARGECDVVQPSDLSLRLQSQPKDLGYLLLTAGAIGFVLPGPGTPAIVAGGLILWPSGFRRVEGWFQRRFPDLHKQGIAQLNRYLNDLESRYPGSTNEGGDASPEHEASS